MTRPVRSSFRRRVGAAAVLVSVLALGGAACSSGPSGTITDRTIPPVHGTGTDAEPTRTVPPAGTGPQSTVAGAGAGAGAARIDDFTVVNRVTCDLGVTVSITAYYTTTAATDVRFVLDGETVDGTPKTSGEFDLPLPCDGNVHTLVLTAVDGQGQTTVDSRAILTNAEPIGD